MNSDITLSIYQVFIVLLAIHPVIYICFAEMRNITNINLDKKKRPHTFAKWH